MLSITCPFLCLAQAVIGDAQQLSCNCYRLTEAVEYQGGAVWNSAQISLNEEFDFTFDVYLGDIPGGADGIAFVLQPLDTNQVTPGGGLGYEGVSPSLAMSIDTYNNNLGNPLQVPGDIPQDHVAIMANGSVNHLSSDNLAGPEMALVSGNDIEDGQWHVMRVSWNPSTMVINFYMDGSLRTSYTGDIVNDIFGGDPSVFWGFTGSTGSLFNQQEFCFSIIPGLSASDFDICVGEEVDFTDQSYSALGDVVGWEWDFGNGETSSVQSPGQIQYAQPGNYTVTQTIEDSEGCTASDDLEIVVHANPEADFVSSDVCSGQITEFADQTTVSEGDVSDWHWDFGDDNSDTGPSVFNVYDSAGIYDVVLAVESSYGCVDTVIGSVNVFENPTADATHELAGFNATFSTELEVGEEAIWVIQDTAFTGVVPFNYTFQDSGWYDVSLIVTNANGCMDTIDFPVYVEGLPEYEIPNVFTPNGDDFNDRFMPTTYAMVEARMKVYNRWGRPVFNYEGGIPLTDSWGWDGTISGGTKAAEGTYYYVLDLKGINGSSFSEQGTVTLLR